MRASLDCRAALWLMAVVGAGIALTALYPDAYQQDSAYHFLFARWAWRHPEYFVGVWARPLFTFFYSFPAHIGTSFTGYRVVRLFSVAVSAATAWQTWRLARQLKFERAELAIPLLFLQPAFLLVCATALTEPLFALLFVLALRLHLSGCVRAGMLLASLLILARPEGFFIALLWGIWVLWHEFVVPPSGGIASTSNPFRLKAVLRTFMLAGGMLLWLAIAWLITGDALWIVHDWPPDWQAAGQANGTGPLWWYAALLPLIVGPLLLVPFVVGLRRLIAQREFGTGVSAFLTLFIAHSLLFWRGWFGSAGYPRYLVCVSPAMALITLAGWNVLVERPPKFFNLARPAIMSAVLALSGVFALGYVDGWPYAREAWAVGEMREWFAVHESGHPVERMIFSQPYACIRWDCDPWVRVALTGDRERNLETIRRAPSRTLVFWDDDPGPKWYRLSAADFAAAGYVHLRSQSYCLTGWWLRLPWRRFGGVREQQLHLFYKP